jgi:acetate kinase
VSGDTRVLLPAASRGDERARLAIDIFVHRLQAGIGAMLAALGDVPHALVFTDAISEDEPSIRAAACGAFGLLGLELDTQKNDISPLDAD